MWCFRQWNYKVPSAACISSPFVSGCTKKLVIWNEMLTHPILFLFFLVSKCGTLSDVSLFATDTNFPGILFKKHVYFFLRFSVNLRLQLGIFDKGTIKLWWEYTLILRTQCGVQEFSWMFQCQWIKRRYCMAVIHRRSANQEAGINHCSNRVSIWLHYSSIYLWF